MAENTIQIDIDNETTTHNSRESHNAHNGKQVSLISLSPNGTYIVTYSNNDNSIEGWIVKDSKLILDPQVYAYKLPEKSEYIPSIKVNDSKIFCYNNFYGVKVFQMSNEHEQIKLNPPPKVRWPTIYLKNNGNLIIFDYDKILVYSMNIKINDELVLMSSYELIYHVIEGTIDEDNNIWAISSRCLFHWDLETLRLKYNYSLGFIAARYRGSKDLIVITKGNSIVVNYHNEIAIFLKGVHFPIRNIQLEGTILKVELCEVQNDVYLLAFNLPKKDEKQKIILYSTNDINKQPINVSMIFTENDSKNKFILYEYRSESKEAFGLDNGNISYINLSCLNWHEFLESHREDDDFVGWNNYLCQASEKNYYNDTLASPDMENIRSLFSKEHKDITDINFNNQKYKWRIDLISKNLSVYTDKEVLICSEKISGMVKRNWKILNNNALALRDDCYIIIFEYDNNNKSIKIQYQFNKDSKLNLKDFSGFLLPMNIISLKYNKVISSIIEDDRCLAKYGPTLFLNLIKSSDPQLTCYVEDIYNKCTKLIKGNSKRNLRFLKIITLSMYDLYKKYPDYIAKFNSEMFMILDPFNETIGDNKYNSHSHFSAFSQEIEISKITKYSKFFSIFKFFQYLYLLLSYLPDFIITSNSKAIQYITLVVPYVNYSCYPLEYSWWKELFYPKSSVFVITCKKEFYTNWNGEAIISFKWERFGRIYYFINWLIFMVFLVCFTIASYPTYSLTQETIFKLYQTSILFGFFHLIFELRQFVWNPRKYFLSIWNLFDLSSYLSATIASIYWIKYNNIPDWALSISCLLLDLKFLLFFRIFESFGVYFAIMFGVAKRVFSFLIVLTIIILSFAHAFFLLLHPKNYLNSLNSQNPNDPNNPWTLSNTYNQVDKNGNVLNETLIQMPSEDTNLFYSYPTSLLATYLILTGNQDSLSPWTPQQTAESTTLFILMAVFSFLIVIYLMNLFIGLLNMAIEKDNDRASYLAQKAEIIAEIELFCLLPHQRRWRTWFPEVIYYRVDVEKARLYIKEAINKGDWKNDDRFEMRDKILKLLSIEKAEKD